jgi:hypothetical protein
VHCRHLGAEHHVDVQPSRERSEKTATAPISSALAMFGVPSKQVPWPEAKLGKGLQISSHWFPFV